jgi:hypothetical protein
MTALFRLAVPLLALSLAGPVAAEEPRQASGRFASRHTSFEPAGAYAFPSSVGMDDEKGIRIAVSNAGFIAEGIDRYYDRRHFIDTYFRDAETLVVYFDFSPSGAYRGMSYSFGSGDGCGFCYDGSVVSTVQLANGRAKGKVKLAPKPGEAHWDVDIDVPIASSDYGAALPAGGGDPGKAYAAYHAALATGNPDAIKPFLTEEMQEGWAEDRDEIVSSYRNDHPEKSFKIVEGWSRGERALLLVDGETPYMKATSEVQLVKEKGTWRIANEMMKLKLGG